MPKTVKPKLLYLVESCLDRMQEKLNIGNWKEVPISDRQIITLLCFHQAWIYATLNEDLDPNTVIKKVLAIIDRGLLFGAPLPSPHDNLLCRCAEAVSSMKKIERSAQSIKFSSLNNFKRSDSKLMKFGHSLRVETCPSVQSFDEKYFKRRIPVVLEKCIDGWPAVQLWDDPSYLIDKVGDRMVPVELGSKYTDSDWTQKLMTVSDFINDYILNVPSTVGYLAQHQLFDQIPELLSDFNTPDYCCLHDDDVIDNATDVNAWFGPANTVSPLHTDPKHNLLTQVFGEKLVILLAPEDTPYLYCLGNLLQNTSPIDPTEPDYEVYPDFAKAKRYYHLLKPGQMLYIPPMWWHYITSVTPSFSVSFWWE